MQSPQNAQTGASQKQTNLVPDAKLHPLLVPRGTFSPDGCLIGIDGVHTPGTRLIDIPPMLPPDGEPVRDTIVYVNGIRTPTHHYLGDLRLLAASGASVRGVYNDTGGMFRDLRECLDDKYRGVDSTSAKTVATLINQSVAERIPLHLVGHSQGALIICRALRTVWNRALLEGQTPADIEVSFSQIRVETIGGAGSDFPDGPQYVHSVNIFDPVAMFFGVGGYHPLGVRAGRGAVIKKFMKINTNLSHLFDSDPGLPGTPFDRPTHNQRLYFDYRVPFEEARAQIGTTNLNAQTYKIPLKKRC